MSLIWSGGCKKKLLTKIKTQEPSPTYQRKIIFRDSARNPEIFRDGVRRCPFLPSGSIEGTSLLASFSKGLRAGMTVEASIVLPLFLFFFMNLGCAIEMIRLHGNLQLALWQIGSKLSVYGYVLDSGETPDSEAPENEDGGGNWWDSLLGVTIASTYVKAQVVSAAGESYLNHSPLTDGANGLQFWESEIFGSEDEIDLVVTYSVSPLSSLAGFSSFRMVNRYYSHIWNGYKLPDEEEEVQMVYITETGTVYHLTRECTYLQLSTRQISTTEIEEARNQNGSRYQPCLRCANGNMPVIVYITEEGNRYHYSGECSGLRRTVYSVSIADATEEGYRACSRCGH